jgi:AraC-like DNA-binding protein/uncharacterized cupin superfamily protein
MKLADTTSPTAHAGMITLTSALKSERESYLAQKFRINLLGMYYAEVGAEWDSQGKKESNFLHHLEISLSGKREIVHNGKVYPLQAGDVWYFPGNTPVARRCNEDCKVLFFRVSCEWLPGVDPLLDWPGRSPRFIGKTESAQWKPWLNPKKAITTRDLIELRGQLLSWIAQALPELDEIIGMHLATHTQFSAVFEYLENHLSADLRLATLAQIHGISLAAFTMAFSRSIGISPKEYLTRRINQLALEWVTNTDLRMKEIAEKLQFNDEYYFSRFFQKHNGCPPSRYRQNFLMQHRG